jgi:hypothetical protein
MSKPDKLAQGCMVQSCGCVMTIAGLFILAVALAALASL